jgi:predicted nucleic acid-binding protein
MFLDTGGIVAVALPEDVLHATALRIMEAAQGRIVVTEYVLLETINGLSRSRLRLAGHRVLHSLVTDPFCEIIPASSELWQAGLDLHRKRPDKEWSLTDCISFVVMKERGIQTALAHDHHLALASFRPLLREQP